VNIVTVIKEDTASAIAIWFHSPNRSSEPIVRLLLINNCKTLDGSRALDRRRALHTDRGSDSFVLIEAGPG